MGERAAARVSDAGIARFQWSLAWSDPELLSSISDSDNRAYGKSPNLLYEIIGAACCADYNASGTPPCHFLTGLLEA
jgi:hypothetical protein